ncbi:glucosamine-6-phosphate deaminase [Bacillus sp. AFS055030]|uniref:glucosamine-6-phosphate deaminase n=1 Tax=Bacillus sp. AFS055030 TaxID=2033507 RepID=UPI000BFDCF6A|nr:glucosamine-6-phosphate deaminase [Bacillus sp. AFS055030]PGL70991.1 glucosamine-6-phosphate deaminase [Bacillus sp. AFS055030]
MKIKIFETAEQLNQYAAYFVLQQINIKPNLKMGMATGRTPIGLYEELIKQHQSGVVSFKQVSMYNLDEYIGLPKEHNQSFYSFMQKNLYNSIDVKENNLHIPNGNAVNMDDEVSRYDQLLNQVGQLDLQILGIGTNGHIGFNEPDQHLIGGTHVVELTNETKQANSKDFEKVEDVPSYAITMGVRDIMRSKKILFIALGKDKAEIVKEAFQGNISTWCPGSFLQLHPNIMVLLDKEASSLLDTKEISLLEKSVIY